MDLAEISSPHLVWLSRVSSGIPHFEDPVRYWHAVIEIASLGFIFSPDQPTDATDSHGISYSALSAAEAIMTKLCLDLG